MTISSLAGSPAAARPDDPEKLGSAARQFEALLIAQLLKSARESGSGDWTGEKDSPMSSLQEIAEQNLAEVLASQGGLGLAAMIVSQMGPQTNESQDRDGRTDKNSGKTI